MIKSMTGYGSATGVSGKVKITVELRSVNNRFLDCTVRIPRTYTAFEEPIKSVVNSSISRGKVDVFVTLDFSEENDVTITLNESIAAAYYESIKEISNRYGLSYESDNAAFMLARMPDVLKVEKSEQDKDALLADILLVLKDAISDFSSMRAKEGVRLYDDISSRLSTLEQLDAMARERSPLTVAEYRHRLEQKMRDVLQTTNIDEQRILTEAAIFADKVAIDEETVRLRSHIAQFREYIEKDEPVGRKLDFLVQEMNREANTMGSKGNDLEMARIVVDMKAEIEKIREQIQNVE